MKEKNKKGKKFSTIFILTAVSHNFLVLVLLLPAPPPFPFPFFPWFGSIVTKRKEEKKKKKTIFQRSVYVGHYTDTYIHV